MSRFAGFPSRLFRVYIVPGAVFQSVMIGGGYGTGREIVEYFSTYGFIGGLLAIGVAFTALAIVLVLTFEFSRTFGAYDYRKFFKHLLGNGWLSFEILVILQFVLVLAVLGSAAGNVLRENFSLPYAMGSIIMLALVGLLTFFGREVVAKTLTIWTFVLYLVLISFFLTVFNGYRMPPLEELALIDIQEGWFSSGLQYALYNLAVAPLLLYVARDFRSIKETVGSGLVAAALAILPAVVFHIGFVIAPQEVLGQAIPVYWLMGQLGATTLLAVYSVMLLGTFVETGAGMLQGINERIDGYLREKSGSGMSRSAHAGVALIAISASAMLSHLGIARLIAEGYGTMAWGFLLVYVVPLLTLGVYRIVTFNPDVGNTAHRPGSDATISD